MKDGQDYTLEGLKQAIDQLQEGERLILLNLDEEIYHAAPGIGSSLLREAAKSMAHYKTRRDDYHQPKKAFDVGSAVHCLTLEPELFEEKYAIQPVEIKRKQGKAWEEWVKQHPGKTILTETELADVEAMTDALMSQCGKFLTGGYSEVSYWYLDGPTGTLLKARVDYLMGDAAIDLKTTKDDTPYRFTNTVKYEYDLQDALYRRVTGLADMIYIGVGKVKPHPVYLRLQGADVRERAENRVVELLAQIREAEELNDYPAYPIELIETKLTDRERAAMGVK